MQEMTTPKFLTPQEVSPRVRLSITQIWRLRQKGMFPEPVKLGARKIGFRITDIEAWENNRPTSSTDLRAA